MAKNANELDNCELNTIDIPQQFTTSQKNYKSITCKLLLALSLITPFALSADDEKKQNSYGPIKAGETLWDVAKATRSNKDISVEQQIFALYKANPEAFKTGNMNVLPQGKILKLPDEAFVTKTDKSAAKAQLTKHSHALDVLRVDARQLKAAKVKTKQYKKSVTVLQRQLGKYRHKSRSWNKAYTKLVAAKRKYSSSKKNVAKLNSLLLQKATLKYTKPTKQEVESQALVAVKALETKTFDVVKEAQTKALDSVKEIESNTLIAVKEVESNTLVAVNAVETKVLGSVKEVESKTLSAVKDVESTTLKAVNELGEQTLKAVKEVESKSLIAVNETNDRLSQIQTSLTSITESSSSLTEKVNALATLNERVVVLEEELGKNDDILIQLKSSVEKLEVAIDKTTDQLKLQSEKHQQQIKELSELKKSKSEQVASIQNLAESQVKAEKVVTEAIKTTELAEPVKDVVEEVAQDIKAETAINLPEVVSTTEKVIESVDSKLFTEEKEVVLDDSVSAPSIELGKASETENLIADETDKSVVIPEQALADLDDKTNAQTMKVSFNPEIRDSLTVSTDDSTLALNSSEESLLKPKKTRNQLSEFQTNDANAISDQGGTSQWMNVLKDNWIFLVSVINGLILMFVFYWTIKNNSYPEDD